MDEVVVRRVVGVVTLAIAAFLLSWLLPRPGLERLRGADERVVTMDLTRPDSRPEEAIAPVAGEAAAPAETGEAQVLAPAPGEARGGPPVAPAPVPPVAARDPGPPPSAREPVEAVALPKPAAAPQDPPATKAEPRPAPKAEVKPAAKPEPAPEARPAPPPVAAAARPAAESKPPAAPTSPSGKVMVQAGAYSLLDKAEGVRKRASAAGVNCFIAPAETAKGTLYRLRCGPFADRAKAAAAVKALSADGIAAQVIGGG